MPITIQEATAAASIFADIQKGERSAAPWEFGILPFRIEPHEIERWLRFVIVCLEGWRAYGQFASGEKIGCYIDVRGADIWLLSSTDGNGQWRVPPGVEHF